MRRRYHQRSGKDVRLVGHLARELTGWNAKYCRNWIDTSTIPVNEVVAPRSLVSGKSDMPCSNGQEEVMYGHHTSTWLNDPYAPSVLIEGQSPSVSMPSDSETDSIMFLRPKFTDCNLSTRRPALLRLCYASGREWHFGKRSKLHHPGASARHDRFANRVQPPVIELERCGAI